MARVYMTKELADTIKSIRLSNKLLAKELALHIGKSPAYVTKLEKGDILTIAEDELRSIFSFITQENSSFDKTIEKVYETLRYKYSDEEIESQVWFLNYDTVIRKIPIPASLVDEINQILSTKNISRDYLLLRINSNESLSDADILNQDIPYNNWYIPNGDIKGTQSIKIKLNIEQLNKILDKKVDKTKYINMQCIIFYMLKIVEYGDSQDITEDEYKTLMQKTTDFLNGHKFYSIMSRSILIKSVESQEEQFQLLNSFDRENIDIINAILSHISMASTADIKLTNDYLTNFNENLKWDIGFMLKLVGMHFSGLNNLSHSHKKQLLRKIESLILEYEDIPYEQKGIERY